MCIDELIVPVPSFFNKGIFLSFAMEIKVLHYNFFFLLNFFEENLILCLYGALRCFQHMFSYITVFPSWQVTCTSSTGPFILTPEIQS